MSMINISGVPNMGFGGGGYFGGNAATGQPAMGAPGDFGASQFSQPLYNDIFSKFGQQTDYYSGLGAAYGRATGGFGGYGANNADPFTPFGGNAGYNFFDAGAGKVPDSGGEGFNFNAGRDQLAQAMTAAQNPFNNYGGFNPFAASSFGGSTGFGQVGGGFGGTDTVSAGGYPWGASTFSPAAGFGLQNSGGFGDMTNLWGTPSSGSIGGMDLGGGFHLAPSLYGTGFGGGEAFNALPASDPNSFANRFAAFNFPGMNAGSPSQYTYNPYTNAQGQTFDPNVPQGFSNGQEAYGPSAIKSFNPWDPYGTGAGGGLGFTGLPNYGGGRSTGFMGASADQYGNPFMSGNANPYAVGNKAFGGGVGIGGLGMTGSGGWGGSYNWDPSTFGQGGA